MREQGHKKYYLAGCTDRCILRHSLLLRNLPHTLPGSLGTVDQGSHRFREEVPMAVRILHH